MESIFNPIQEVNSRHCFDLTLLPDEVLEQVRDVIHSVASAPDPYTVLKQHLLELYKPDDLDLAFQILCVFEACVRMPLVLMESMLALLSGEEAGGLIFRAIF